MEENKYGILFVDDEANILSSLKRLFRKEPYRVTLADSAEEGLEKLKEGGSFQLIISDYRMPGKNGVEFLTEAKEISPDSIRMVLSGYADVGAILAAVNEGEIYKFMTKPWNDDDLKITVRRAMEQYALKQQNRALTEELKEINRDLEAKVEERTMELQLRNRVLVHSQEILELLPFAVIGLDMDGLITLTNRKGAEMACSGNYPVGSKVESLLPAEVVGLIDEMRSDGKNKEYHALTINGREYNAMFAILGSGGDVRGYILTFADCV